MPLIAISADGVVFPPFNSIFIAHLHVHREPVECFPQWIGKHLETGMCVWVDENTLLKKGKVERNDRPISVIQPEPFESIPVISRAFKPIECAQLISLPRLKPRLFDKRFEPRLVHSADIGMLLENRYKFHRAEVRRGGLLPYGRHNFELPLVQLSGAVEQVGPFELQAVKVSRMRLSRRLKLTLPLLLDTFKLSLPLKLHTFELI